MMSKAAQESTPHEKMVMEQWKRVVSRPAHGSTPQVQMVMMGQREGGGGVHRGACHALRFVVVERVERERGERGSDNRWLMPCV